MVVLAWLHDMGLQSLERLPGMDTLTTPATSWVKGLRGWAKGQLYSYEHKEKWVHKGFLEVSNFICCFLKSRGSMATDWL